MRWRLLIAGCVAALLSGCAQMGYYMQAAQGQYALLSEARPIDDWLADPDVGESLKLKLEKVKKIRHFAAQELALPDNGSFKSYADVKRPYVLWNVVATPALSMRPKQWCFPIAGCVNYRGYYSQAEAQAYAAELRREHYDVQVAGVPAYSTLGWFNDPVISTFIHYPEAELARLVFHELAHQVVYVPGDSAFNESFATAVEEAGVERWMVVHGDDKMRQSYFAYDGRKKDFLRLLQKHRLALIENYARNVSDAEKITKKVEIFQGLKDEYQTLKTAWGGYQGYDRWFAEPLSNAHLAAIATYHDYVPSFRALLLQEKKFSTFYQAVQTWAELDPAERHRQLLRIGPHTLPAVVASEIRATSPAR